MEFDALLLNLGSPRTCTLLGSEMEKTVSLKLVPSTGLADRASAGDSRVSAFSPMTSFNPTVSTILIILVEELDSFSGEAPSRLLTMWTEVFPSARLTVGPDSSVSS